VNEKTARQHWFIIANPVSGNGTVHRKWSKVQAALNNAHIPYEFELTTKAGDGRHMAIQAIQKGYRKIICVGGDGNMHDVANGILNQTIVPATDISLAIISLGTGNDWIRTFHMPHTIDGAVAVIKRGNTTLQDVGLVHCYDKGLALKRYFINFAGCGFDSYVVERTAELKKFGTVAYLLGMLRWLVSFQKPKLKITANGQSAIVKAYMTIAGIGKYCGGGMQLTPGAVPDDGLFHVTIAKDISKLEVLRRIKMLYDGSLPKHKDVWTFTTSSLKIEVVQSAAVVKMQTDGDLAGEGPFELNVVHKALRVVIP
jgi:diacylglycerol kinase (ATP)